MKDVGNTLEYFEVIYIPIYNYEIKKIKEKEHLYRRIFN